MLSSAFLIDWLWAGRSYVELVFGLLVRQDRDWCDIIFNLDVEGPVLRLGGASQAFVTRSCFIFLLTECWFSFDEEILITRRRHLINKYLILGWLKNARFWNAHHGLYLSVTLVALTTTRYFLRILSENLILIWRLEVDIFVYWVGCRAVKLWHFFLFLGTFCTYLVVYRNVELVGALPPLFCSVGCWIYQW